MKFFRRLLILVSVPVFLFALPADGEDWQNLAQPIGNLVIVETATTVNTRLGGNPPFETRTDVTTINTTVPQYFVRFYNPTDATNPSNAVGSWIMRSATVRGLTPSQVRDIFALPAMPTHMTMVLVPTGYNMYTGIAGPIAGWGAGGAQQSKLIGPPWVPTGNYFNQQPVMAVILSYRLVAPNGNTGSVAAYLDARIPAAYSDFEYVYLNLDMLYMPDTASRLRDALDQIGPVRYDHLTANALHAAVLLNDAVDRRIDSLFTAGKGDSSRPTLVASLSPLPMIGEKQEGSGSRMWARGIGGNQRAGNLGFNSLSGGLVGGTETRFAEESLAGFSMGFLHSRLDWTGNGGDVATDYARLGAYAVWMPGDLFLQAGMNGGIARSDASRRIEFPGIDRTAFSRFDAWELNPRVRLGYRLPLAALDVVPSAGIDFFYRAREGFTESGADSLNLRVASEKNQTLRSHLEIAFSKDLELAAGMTLRPVFQMGWAREQYFDDHVIKAALGDQPDQFTVYGDSKTADILTTGLGIMLKSGRHFSFFAHYGLEYREDRKDQTLSLGLDYRF
jgi:outer membrane autotransporter protein